MHSPKASIFLVCLTMALSHPTGAHNAPPDFVAAHNAARVEVGVPLLVWNDALAAYAESHARNRSGDCVMVHSTGPYGENIAEGSWDLSAKEAVGIWLEEKQLYNVGSNSCSGDAYGCLHYTQVVWRHTARVGCGRAQCTNNGWTFVTCSYDPPGNVVGERPY